MNYVLLIRKCCKLRYGRVKTHYMLIFHNIFPPALTKPDQYLKILANMCEKHCGDCNKFTVTRNLDIGVSIGKRRCGPPFPFFETVLSDAGCIDPENPSRFSPKKLTSKNGRVPTPA